jgi:acyl carrier protein
MKPDDGRGDENGLSSAQISTLRREEVERRVLEIIARAMDRPVEEVKPTSTMEGDLGAQSLDYLDIAFSLEREFRIQFPRAEFLQRAGDHLGEDKLVRGEVITDLGLKLLAKGMPELDPARLKPGLRVTELRQMFLAASFVRVVIQLLESKARMDRKCPDCGSEMTESNTLPEFNCPQCGNSVALPSGDEILTEGLLSIAQELAPAAAGDSE